MLKPFRFLPLVLCVLIAGTSAGPLRAQGNATPSAPAQILSYDSDITVSRDSTLVVRATLKIQAPGGEIEHGIYQDVATRYRDRFGNPYDIHIQVTGLQRDGQPQDFRLRKRPDGLRIYLDDGDSLPAGEHTYELTYAVNRELGFFPDHDELYWNVTGNGWPLPIQQASATVHLPAGIAQEAFILDGYTGRQGSAASDFTASADNQSNATFHTTRALGPYEGLTIVVRWPKGFVHPPTPEQEHQYFLEDNQAVFAGIAGLVVLLIYYAGVWLLVGLLASRRETVPQPTPPRRFSPAALRYVWRRTFDAKTMVASLISLAVRGHVAILEDSPGAFILGRLKSPIPPAGATPGPATGFAPKIAEDEKLVLDKLFAGQDAVPLEPTHHAAVGAAVEALRLHLRCGLEKIRFLTTARYLIPGLLISLGTVVRCGFTIQGGQRVLIFSLVLWLLLWSLGCLALAAFTITSWRNALSDPHHAPTARRHAMVISAICFCFFLGEALGLSALAWAASSTVVAVLLLLAIINYAAHIILRTPSVAGRALMDEVEAFRMFMTSTEKERGEVLPPSGIPRQFEAFLPYAMALNVEKTWGEKFGAALAQTALEGKAGYSPGWYSGLRWDPITASTFATSLGNSLSGAVSSATTARPSHPGAKPPAESAEGNR